jgi:divalent metal cation (Fe/Co/Zn/Cd) transporter
MDTLPQELPADVLLRRGLNLEYVTLSWNVVGSAIVIAAGTRVGSVALTGFGLDSLIEIFASVVVVWQLTAINRRNERLSLRLISVAFFLLSAFVLTRTALALAEQSRPEKSLAGIIWLTASVAVMLLLAWGKLDTGRRLGNSVLATEAKVTLIDAYLAAATLAGVSVDAVLGYWWADSIASLVIVFYGIREGIAAWRHGTSERFPTERS